MRKLIVTILVVLCCQAKAQKTYLNIETNTTLGFSSSSSLRFSNYDMSIDHRFSFKHYMFVPRFLSLNLGVSAGVELKSGNKWEFGISSGEAKTAYSIYTRGIVASYNNQDTVYNVSEKTRIKGYDFLQLRGLYYRNLSKTSNRNYLIGGLMLGVLNTKRLEVEEEELKNDGSYRATTTSKFYIWDEKNFYIVTGFEHRVVIKDMYLFNLTTLLNLAITKNNFINHNIDISITDQVQTKNYSYSIYSRGSGVLVQLSRTFNIDKAIKKASEFF